MAKYISAYEAEDGNLFKDRGGKVWENIKTTKLLEKR